MNKNFLPPANVGAGYSRYECMQGADASGKFFFHWTAPPKDLAIKASFVRKGATGDAVKKWLGIGFGKEMFQSRVLVLSEEDAIPGVRHYQIQGNCTLYS